jgi:hypothetical protein
MTRQIEIAAVAFAALLASGCMAEVDEEDASDVATAELDELFAVCEERPGSTVRLFDPLDPTVYAEVPCSLFASIDDEDPFLSWQAIREPKRPIREPPPGFDEPPPDWYEPSLYGGAGVWGPGRDSPHGSRGGLGGPAARGGSSSRDGRGPAGPLGVLCVLSWNSAQWAAFMTRYCAKRHSGVGGAGAATPEEAAERVRTCQGWTMYGFGMVMGLCGAL